MQQVISKVLPHLANFLMQEYQPEGLKQSTFSSQRLNELVEKYSFNRNYNEYPKANKKARDFLIEDFKNAGYNVSLHNDCDNILASYEPGKKILITGHYDGPHNSPGADDNASALAVMIHLAESLPLELKSKVNFLSFNREECNILGSKLFLENEEVFSSILLNINLEMVGYYSNEPSSQKMPEGFPPIDKGNFLALVGNNNSGSIIADLIKSAKECNLSLPLIGFNVPFGLEFKLPELERLLCSDHSRFWEKEIPAIMLTDTSDYRNDNYHRESDLPDTLDYDKMAMVVELLFNYVKEK